MPRIIWMGSTKPYGGMSKFILGLSVQRGSTGSTVGQAGKNMSLSVSLFWGWWETSLLWKWKDLSDAT